MLGHVVAPTTHDQRLVEADLLRCLRCDAWVPRSALDTQAEVVPLPRRGAELHQAIVLRLIALDRLFHAVVLIPIGIFLGWLWLNIGSLSPEARDIAKSLSQVSNGVGHLGGQLGSVANRVATLKADHVRNLALLALAYGVVEGIEAVGLWLEKRWAEYLTVVVTASLLPLEILELTRRITVLRVVGFVINVAVVIYLLWAKRLFGLRGGPHELEPDLETIAASPAAQRARRAG
jgi:hypothetical protein